MISSTPGHWWSNYASYAFNATSEANCSVNKAIIYVGANDGMLHAFRDCDGSEAWAFIPPDLLPNLQYLRGSIHTPFVDSTPVAYIYDANGNGTIESGDKVILIFGERRGGGKDTAPTGGFYYTFDVTNPESPVYLWRLSNTVSPSGVNTDYSELAETWSEPKIGKVKVGSTDKVAAFVGAGYDNLNEDRRYGAVQTFPAVGPVDTSDTGGGAITSIGGSVPSNPKGRGIYVVEIATLSSTGVPSFGTSGYKIWGYTNADDSGMTFSIPSEMSIQDTDYNGYIDRLYVGDTGGNLWRFNVGSTSNWSGVRLFASNPASGADTGRKIFYRPSVTFEKGGYEVVFFGTGDREHPSNTAVTDRLYSIKDTGQAGVTTEGDLYNATADTLQTTSDVQGEMAVLNSKSGWYIKLNEYPGEKVLAAPFVLGGIANYATYTPDTGVSANPCETSNIGTAAEYSLRYMTGEAAINYYTGNDSITPVNSRAKDSYGQTLSSDDRRRALGQGMPFGFGVLIDGDVRKVTGTGEKYMIDLQRGVGTIPLYWRQK